MEKAEMHKSSLVEMLHSQQRLGFQLQSETSLDFNIYISIR